MLHTTFAKAKENRACIKSYRKMVKAMGGISKYGKDTPIPLDKVLEICGLQDTVWALRCTIEPSANIIIEFVCRCAEHTLHFFEDKYPDDKRPRLAIEAARACLTDKSPSAAWSAASSAAWSAESAKSAACAESAKSAKSAASAAWSAESAAWSAESAKSAASAEQQWQISELLKILKGI